VDATKLNLVWKILKFYNLLVYIQV
jgi:hypothetical protein